MDDINNPSDPPVIDPMPKLIRGIINIQYCIDHPEEQSRYFGWGIEQNKSKLADLKHQYRTIMESVNSHDIDFFIAVVNEGRKKDFNVRLDMGMADRLRLLQKVQKKKQDENYLFVRLKYKNLKNIEDEDPNRFIE